MKALVYEGVESLEFRDVPEPATDEGDALVRVKAVGICGSDMHAYHGQDSRRPAPLILGHEAAGLILAGEDEGARVTVNPLVPCGVCAFCKAGRENICPNRQLLSMPPREGAFAQLLAVPAKNLVSVPDHVSLAKAALAEPLAVSWHAARLGLEALREGNTRRALVLGGGAIGVAAALALKAQGIADVALVEPNEARRAYLEQHVACDVLASPEGLYGIVVDAVGYDATRAASSEAV
ncbi:MAG: alcohol dehydrogenase catalytic domain-containing protein, partial [Pseudomonadota bacterium]